MDPSVGAGTDPGAAAKAEGDRKSQRGKNPDTRTMLPAEPTGSNQDGSADEEEFEPSTISATEEVRRATPAAGVSLRSAPSAPRVGIPRALKKWDRYEVQEVLGSGGMGAVYKARDSRLNRLVALKIVHPMLGQASETAGEVFVRRFLREARLQASLEHPHICKVYEIGELPKVEADEPAYPYIAMQLISGQSLQRAAADMSMFEKVKVIQQVADALHTAHRQGLIHRDI